MKLCDYIVGMIDLGVEVNMAICKNGSKMYRVHIADHDVKYSDPIPEDVQNTDIDDLLIL